MGIKHKPCEFDRFIGKWTANVNGEPVSIEFGSGGTFDCFSKNSVYQKMMLLSEEYGQKFSLINKTKSSPTWNIKKGKLFILLSAREQSYKYDFSDNDTTLCLTKIGTKEKLSFVKDSTGSSISSLIPWLFKINALFTFLYIVTVFLLVFLILYIKPDLGMGSLGIAITLVISIISSAIVFYYIRYKLIASKIKK